VIGFRYISAAIIAVSLGATAHAQDSSSEVTNIDMTLYRAITISKVSDLSFGTVVKPNEGGSTVSISHVDGEISSTGGVVLLSTGPNAPPSRATFLVNGEGGQSFGIDVPGSFNLFRDGGGGFLTVQTSNDTVSTLSGALGGNGAVTIGVGGTISITDAQATGFYSGTFTVTAYYN